MEGGQEEFHSEGAAIDKANNDFNDEPAADESDIHSNGSREKNSKQKSSASPSHEQHKMWFAS